MDNSTGSEKLDNQEPIEPSSNILDGGEAKSWDASKPGQSYDIEMPRGPNPSHLIDAGKIEAWIRFSEVLIKWSAEETRRRLVLSTERMRIALVVVFMLFFTAWFIFGLYAFFHLGTILFLVSGGIFVIPITAICYHYFRRPGG